MNLVIYGKSIIGKQYALLSNVLSNVPICLVYGHVKAVDQTAKLNQTINCLIALFQ